MGLRRPFRNPKSVRERGETALHKEMLDQPATEEAIL